jgi:hypothetical protein
MYIDDSIYIYLYPTTFNAKWIPHLLVKLKPSIRPLLVQRLNTYYPNELTIFNHPTYEPTALASAHHLICTCNPASKQDPEYTKI